MVASHPLPHCVGLMPDLIILERANPRYDFDLGARYTPPDDEQSYILRRLVGAQTRDGKARLTERHVQALRDLGLSVEIREWEA